VQVLRLRLHHLHDLSPLQQRRVAVVVIIVRVTLLRIVREALGARLVVEVRVAAVVGVVAQPALVLDLPRAVAQVEGDLLVLAPDLVPEAPPAGVPPRIVLEKEESIITYGE
jgi:hypothetical protein